MLVALPSAIAFGVTIHSVLGGAHVALDTLAVVLFIREQIGGSIVRRQLLGNETFSRRIRTHEEREILTTHAARAAIIELQGSLFFGTADQLQPSLEPQLKTRDFQILDMRRIQTVDVTAAHLLEQAEDMPAWSQGFLIFSAIPATLPPGHDTRARPSTPLPRNRRNLACGCWRASPAYWPTACGMPMPSCGRSSPEETGARPDEASSLQDRACSGREAFTGRRAATLTCRHCARSASLPFRPVLCCYPATDEVPK